MDFITNRKQLRPDLSDLSINEKEKLLSKSAFITEDLSPQRFKAFCYVTDYNYDKNVFDYVTTFNGKVLCKAKNEDTYYHIASTEDFHAAGIPYDVNFDREFEELLFVS